jgi:hypothetical protein
MSDDVKQAIADLQSFVVCRCSPAYTGRKLRDPDCYCGYAPEVKAVADRIEGLEAKLAKAVEALDEAVYMLGVTDEDIAKGAGIYRIASTLIELKAATHE